MASNANLHQPSRELQSPSPKLPSHPSTIADEVNTGTQNPRPKRPYGPQCDHCQCYNCRRHRELESLSQSRRSSQELKDDTNGDDDYYGDADDDDDIDKDDPDGDGVAEIVKSWRDSVKPGPPPGSSARSSQSWDITGRDKIVLFNRLRGDERVTPLYVTALLEMSEQPFDPEKEGYKNHVHLHNKIDTFVGSRSSNFIFNHTTFLGNLREVLPLSGDSFINTLKTLRMDREAPEIEFITDVAGEELMEHHLQSLLLNEYGKVPNPDVVVGMPFDWIKSIAIEIAGSRGTAIAWDILKECRLYAEGPFFPYLLVLFHGEKMLEEELGVGFAAALASGSGWIGQDNPIFGLTVTKNIAMLYIAWAVTCEEEGLTYTKYIYRRMDKWFHIDHDRYKVAELERLQGVIMRIHLWGTGDRRKKLESELTERIRMQSRNQA